MARHGRKRIWRGGLDGPRPRTTSRAPAIGVIAAAAAGLVLTVPAAAAPRPRTQDVIVRATPGRLAAAKAAVRRAGGTVRLDLGVIGGFTARVPSRSLAVVRRSGAVRTLTPNRRLRSLSAADAYDPLSDPGSWVNTALVTGASAYWSAGYTGRGVDVALLDSGVAPVDGLRTPGKVVNGPDLSFESQSVDEAYLDTFGHGTHMAGLIAGRSDDVSSSSGLPTYSGMAPDARLLSLKLADKGGATDVSQVIAAIDWVVQHRYDNGLNIRVINLSYGTDSTQPYTVDPLAFAAEQAWKKGIVVVTAAGNAGYRARTGSMTNPAIDPFVIAVGSSDSRGTTSKADDVVSDFSSSGAEYGAPGGFGTTRTGKRPDPATMDTTRVPDLVAPGKSLVSLRVPGSNADANYGSTGLVTDELFRGSGTSQAAAVVSGAVALILQQRPSLTPDQVKALLTDNAYGLDDSIAPWYQGHGELDLERVLKARTPSPRTAAQAFAASTGTGPIDAARGSSRLAIDDVPLQGEIDIFGMPVDTRRLAAETTAGRSWTGTSWNGSDWTGSGYRTATWAGLGWERLSWTRLSWSRLSWSEIGWSRLSWSDAGWSRLSWTDSGWTRLSWSGSRWERLSWG